MGRPRLFSPASASAGNSRQVTYFKVSKASVVVAVAAGTIQAGLKGLTR